MLGEYAGRRAVLAVLTVLTASVLVAPVAAAEPETVSIGVEELDYFPNYALRDGQYVGAARDILDAFAADAGLRLVYRPLPVKRLYADLFAGAVDLKFPDSPGWNAAGKQGQNVVYSRSVLPYIDGVMVKPERKGKGLDGFAVLGTVSGFTPFAWLETLGGGAVKLSENPQIDSLLKQTMAGRVDGAYVNVAVARHQLRTMLSLPDALVFDAGLPHSAGDYVVSTIHRPDIVAKFNDWLVANTTKTIEIKAKYNLTE